MSLLIVIVNYRTPALVIDCLRTIVRERSADPSLRVVVTDNNSGDDSVPRISGAIRDELWGEWATFMPLDRNGGFSAGNNAAIRVALREPNPPDYIMLLNPDTLAQPGAFSELLSFFQSHPKAGVLGSQLEFPHGGGLQHSARWMMTPLTELDGAARFGPLSRMLGRHSITIPHQPHPHTCDWVSGAALVARREVLQQIGLLDEGYFLYFDEVDFCRRARKAGWEVWHVPASRIVHLEGVATGIKETRKRRGKYWYDSRRRFYIKSYGVPGWLVADVLWAAGRASLGLRRLLHLGGSMEGDPLRYTRDLLGGDLRALFSAETWRIDRREKPA